jgi:hypothetical protein
MGNTQTPKITGFIVGVAGKKRHGKDTVADHLAAKYGFVKIAFADPLRQIIGKQLLYLTDEQMEDGPKKEEIDPRWGKSPRRLLQVIGTDMFREVLDNEFWVRRCMYRVAEIWAKDPSARVAISDCRFPNELEAVKKVGYALKVERPDLPIDDTHKSEMALHLVPDDAYHSVIRANSGELDIIRHEVDLVMEKILHDRERIRNAV